MAEEFTAFTTSLLGSLPRSEALIEARDRQEESPQAKDHYQQVLRDDTEQVVRMQEDLGVDVLTSGEFDRDNYMSYVAQYVDGIDLLTMDELVSLTDDNEAFQESLETMEAAGIEIKNPVVTHKIDTQARLDVDEMVLLQSLTDQKIKATLPSPYLLTRSCWVDGVTDQVYEDKHALGQDIIQLLTNEIHRLVELGVDVIQLDDPILSEIVYMSSSEDTSFY